MKKIDFMEERRSFAAELIPPGRIPDALLSGTLEHLPIPGLCILINPTNYTNYTPPGIQKKKQWAVNSDNQWHPIGLLGWLRSGHPKWN